MLSDSDRRRRHALVKLVDRRAWRLTLGGGGGAAAADCVNKQGRGRQVVALTGSGAPLFDQQARRDEAALGSVRESSRGKYLLAISAKIISR